MKINAKGLLIILLISVSYIESFHSSFRASFGLRKNKNLKSNSSTNTNTSTAKSKGRTNSKAVVVTKFFAVSTSITKSKTVTTTSGSTSSSVTRGGDIPDYPIYFDGWVKYLRYTETKIKKPKAFYKNTRFAAESRAKFSLPDLDKVIRNKNII
jgi:hypothetical protein